MKKIPTIFIRDFENNGKLLNQKNPECEWVFNGEGIATRKFDGTCVKIECGKYFKRREVKKNKTPPADFIEEQLDTNTGKRIGWMPVTDAPEDKHHIEGYNNMPQPLPDGTYELVGPKIQGDPEDWQSHALIKHLNAETFGNVPVDFNELKNWMSKKDIEGLVFHHPDGRMGKIKKKDFGLKRR